MNSRMFRYLFISFIFLVAMPFVVITIATANSPVVYDDFNSDTIDLVRWTAVQVGSGSTATETNQRLEITHLPDAAGSIFRAGFTSACALRGDFDIQVDFDLPTWQLGNLAEDKPGTGVKVGFTMGGIGNTERTSFGSLSADFPGQPREVYLTNFGDGVQGFISTTDLSGKLRVTRAGSTVTGFFFNTSASVWVPIHTYARATTRDVRFNLNSWSHDSVFSDQEAAVAFDNILINLGTLICRKVHIDIKPGSDPNSINCSNGKGLTPVAILTTEIFDANTVDHSTVAFEGSSEVHVDKKSGEPRRHEEDVDGDGDTDLMLHFRLGETDLSCSSTEGALSGETFDGQAIEGTDTVRMVGG